MVIKSTKYRRVNGKNQYWCGKCKKWKPEYSVSADEWKKLPLKYRRNDTLTLCKDCFIEITKSIPQRDMLLGPGKNYTAALTTINAYPTSTLEIDLPERVIGNALNKKKKKNIYKKNIYTHKY